LADGHLTIPWKGVIELIRSDKWIPKRDEFLKIYNSILYRDSFTSRIVSFRIEQFKIMNHVPDDISSKFNKHLPELPYI
jgi:hypothetical protein